MHAQFSYHEWKRTHRCHHGAQQTRRQWILKERSGGEWAEYSLLITILVYSVDSQKLHLVGLRVCAMCSRQTNPVQGAWLDLDLQGKIANFSPSASCHRPVYLEAWVTVLTAQLIILLGRRSADIFLVLGHGPLVTLEVIQVKICRREWLKSAEHMDLILKVLLFFFRYSSSINIWTLLLWSVCKPTRLTCGMSSPGEAR